MMSLNYLKPTTRRLLLTALVVLAGACGEGVSLEPLPAGATILAFGDSLTHGTGAGRGESYPAVLAELTGRTVINAGVPGELSAEGRERLPGVLAEHAPALLILCHGGNDMLRKRDLARAAENLEAMISHARERGVQVMLIGVPKPGLLLGTAEFYRRVARELEVPLEDEALADVLASPALKADPVHPNAAGYRELAERVHARLLEAGAL